MKIENKIFWSWMLMFVLVDILDLISTMIDLQIPGVYEINPVSAYFFTFGPIGYLFAMVWAFSVMIAIMIFVRLVMRLYKLMTGNETPVLLQWIVYSMTALSAIIGKLLAVFSNTMIILLHYF